MESLAELVSDISGEQTKPITTALLANVDLIITRGIAGMERMRLARDDIRSHVQALATELKPTTPKSFNGFSLRPRF